MTDAEARRDERTVPPAKVYAADTRTRRFLASLPRLTVATLFSDEMERAKGATPMVLEGIRKLRKSCLDGTMWDVEIPLAAPQGKESTLPNYVERAWSALTPGVVDKTPYFTVLHTIMGLGNNVRPCTCDEVAREMKCSKQYVSYTGAKIAGDMFAPEMTAQFGAFARKAAEVFAAHGNFIGRKEFALEIDRACGWEGTTYMSAHKLLWRVCPDDVSFDGSDTLAWKFETESAEIYSAFKASLAAESVTYPEFGKEQMQKAMAARGFALSDSAYEFMARRIVDDEFEGNDPHAPCHKTMARKLGISVIDVGATDRLLREIFDEGGHVYTRRQLVEACRRKEPTMRWTIGKINSAIYRRYVAGGMILHYERGRKNASATTFTLDVYVSAQDKRAARAAVGELAKHFKATGEKKVDIAGVYGEFKPKLSPGFPKLCFYELVRHYGKGRVKCRKYTKVEAL